MNSSIHVLCIINPAAGNSLCRQRWPMIASMMDAFHLTFEPLMVEKQPLLNAVMDHLGRKGVRSYDVICGVGGDGTQSQIINALMRFQNRRPDCPLPPYAFIPLGTGNDIAKSFGLIDRGVFQESDLRKAVATIRYGADYLLDLGRINDLYFVDALTVGLDSHVLQEHNRHRMEMGKYPVLSRLVRGNLLYTWCLGLRFWKHASIETKVEVDGAVWYQGPIVNLIVNNTRVYGGEFVICPNAYANDGLLEVVVFAGHYDYLARYLLALRSNPREIHKMAERLAREASYIQGHDITIKLSRKEAAQYDGEVLPSCDSFEIEVVPRAIHIKAPVE